MSVFFRNFFVSGVFLSIFASGLLPLQGEAARFSNQFVEFELPPQWECTLEGAEWLCQSRDESRKRDAIIILAAKLKGPQDSLDQYLEYLKGAKTYQAITGQSVKSEPRYAKTIRIQDQPWVDALHLESELPGFYTRYLATVKQDIGVLVTYSINQEKYQYYLNDFENLVRTLRVFRRPGGLNTLPAQSDIFRDTNIPQHVAENSVFSGAIPDTRDGSTPAQPSQGDNSLILLLLIGGGAVGFIIWKRKQQS
jgi:hypothetical protein